TAPHLPAVQVRQQQVRHDQVGPRLHRPSQSRFTRRGLQYHVAAVRQDRFTDPPPIIVVIDDQYRAIRHERIAPVESAGAPWNTRAPDSSMSMRWRRRWPDQASDLRLQRGGTEWSGQDAGAAGTQQ